MNDARKKLKIKDFNNTEILQAVNTIAVEFNTYLEAKAYIHMSIIWFMKSQSLKSKQIDKEEVGAKILSTPF